MYNKYTTEHIHALGMYTNTTLSHNSLNSVNYVVLVKCVIVLNYRRLSEHYIVIIATLNVGKYISTQNTTHIHS